MDTEKQHIDDLIEAFLTEGLNASSQKELDEWISFSPENKEYFMKTESIWFSAISSKAVNRFDYEKGFKTFEAKVNAAKKISGKKINLRMRRVLQYAAAIAVLFIIAYSTYWMGLDHYKHNLAEIVMEAPAGSQAKMSLPDGTTVILNAGSKISYSQNFGIEERRVKLQGEGYFEVAHDKEKPFSVLTKELRVTVLGTKFNFKNYPDDDEIIVSLFEGKVALYNMMREENSQCLLPNEKIFLNKREGIMHKISAKSTISDKQWVSGVMQFDEMPLTEVAKVLERNYNVNISFANDSLGHFRFYGKFSKEQTLDDIMKEIASTGKIRYALKGRDVTIY